MKYNSSSVLQEYENNLNDANKAMKSLSFYCSDSKVNGFTGWVFEETIHCCLREELNYHNRNAIITEQFKLSKLAKGTRGIVDLLVSNRGKNIFIEIKYRGMFSNEGINKYADYKKIANQNGYEYLYITCSETYKSYKNQTGQIFGNNNAFFLNDSEQDEWCRFIVQ